MDPIALFGLQYTLSLVAYALIGFWYVQPRLNRLPVQAAVVPLLWVHAFRIVGGTILAPGAVDAAVPMDFRNMVGIGDLATAILALVALIALRVRFSGAIALVWLCVGVGLVDTVNAIAQSLSYMQSRLPEMPARLRGHVKNHKSPHIARMQIEYGAFGVVSATIWEAIVMARTGIDEILVANELVVPAKRRAAALLAREVNLQVLVDDV